MQTSAPLTEQQTKDWTEYVLSQFPNEACAYIAGGSIFPVHNSSATPTDTFTVHPIERMKAEAQGEVTGFLHSHPKTPLEAGKCIYPTFWPSGADMQGWLRDDLRWGISATDGEFVTDPVWLDENYTAPLEGRVFIHGIWDCYAAVRDWFKVNRNITLKNYARGMDWWNKGQDLYSSQFQDAGFVEIDSDQVVPGDCVLMTIHSRGVPCHAAVIHDDNTLYHHTFSRSGQALSGYVSRGKWAKHIHSYVRYVGLHK